MQRVLPGVGLDLSRTVHTGAPCSAKRRPRGTGRRSDCGPRAQETSSTFCHVAPELPIRSVASWTTAPRFRLDVVQLASFSFTFSFAFSFSFASSF